MAKNTRERHTPMGKGKKAYRTPTLRTYGDVRQITRAGSSGGADDNSKGKGQNKTGVSDPQSDK